MNSLKSYYRDRYRFTGEQHSLGGDPTISRRVALALQMVGASPKRILDFGCQIGIVAARLLQAGHEVCGVDISQSAIERAQESFPQGSFELIDSESRLPFPPASFDACVAMEVIEHLFDVPGFIQEVHRILVPDGIFVIGTPYHGWFKNLAIVSFNFERHFKPTGGHIRFFSVKSLGSSLESKGFRVEEIRGLGRVWPFWKSMFLKARKV